MSVSNTHHRVPKKPVMIDAKDISLMTARLAQILAEEVDLLKEAKVRDIEKLQQEKIFLIDALETQKKLIQQRPELVDTIPSRDKHDLQKVADLFEDILKENHMRLRMAKEVNEQIVAAITESVSERSRTPYYGRNGMTGTAVFERNSVSLNEKI